MGQPGLTTDAASGSEDERTYDFFDELAGVTPVLSGVDFASCTLVGTLSENGPFDTGYTMPASAATALAGSGFQLVNAATDHILERGLDGLTETVHILQEEGLVPVGAYANQQSQSAFIADIHGLNVALLSYTCGTGGVSVSDTPWCVNILTQDYMTDQETVDYDRVAADIDAVRRNGADIVVCYIYWWDNTQYYTTARKNQSDVAERLFAEGVDVLVGSGVKTPEPIETATVERADGTKANCVALYNLSNLMSCFNDRYTNLSAVAKVFVSRDTETGECWVSGVSYDPMFMLDTDDYADYSEPGYKYRLLSAYDAIAEHDDGDRSLSELAYKAVVQGVQDLQDIMGAEYDAANGGVTLEYPY